MEITDEVATRRPARIVAVRVPGLKQAALERFAARAARAVKLNGKLNLMVTSSKHLRELNRRFRGQDAVTDVLSFPAAVAFAGQLAGDIAISGEIAAANARSLGHSPADEVKILALHGILHLAGYDHEQDNGQMERRERQLRKAFGLPSGLIERTAPRPVKTAHGPSPRDVGLRRKPR